MNINRISLLFVVLAIAILASHSVFAGAKFTGGAGSFADINFFGKQYTVSILKIDNDRYTNMRDRSCSFSVGRFKEDIELYQNKRVDEVGITVSNIYREDDMNLCEFTIAGEILYSKMVLPGDEILQPAPVEVANKTPLVEIISNNSSHEIIESVEELLENDSELEPVIEPVEGKTTRVVQVKKHSFIAWIKSIYGKLF
jgi:hypothetical protein